MNWLTPDNARALGLALLHFLWQGMALAAVLGVFLTVCRKAAVRYGAAVFMLALMMTAPLITFFSLRRAVPAPSPAHVEIAHAGVALPYEVAMHTAASPPAAPAPSRRDLWLLEAWCAGVAFFSLRAVGGFFVLERLRRCHTAPVGPPLHAICLQLQQRLGISRAVRYCESRLLQVPAVVGWFRPVVLLPVSALAGLTPQQLEMIIAHELAHIRRFDALVNIFQVAVETLLFYHPAVWWVSRRIRAERENCCDDVAVALCGGRVAYARALTLMEEWRATPRLAMAASGSPLAGRVLRILRVERAGSGLRGAGAIIALLCLALALGAGDVLLGQAVGARGDTDARQSQVGATDPAEKRPVGGVKGGISGGVSSGVRGGVRGGIANGVDTAVRTDVAAELTTRVETAHAQAESRSGSYIDGLKAAGLTEFTVDQLIAMKIHGVSPDFVRAIRQLGFTLGPNQLVAFRIHQVTPEFIREVQATGLRPTADQLVAMRIHGVGADYVRALQSIAPANAGADYFVSAKVMGITPELVEKARSRGFKNLGLEQLRELKDLI